MAVKTPPYFKWRSGRPRWEPGPGLRNKGWIGLDLKDEQAIGRWLGLEAAIAAAEKINAEVAHWRRTGERPALSVIAPPPKEPRGKTCRALWERYETSVRHQAKAPATRADYRNKASLFLKEFGDAPVAALTKPILHGYWEEQYRERGHAMANGIIAVVRAMLSHAELIGWRAERSNPAFQLGLVTLPPRVKVWTPAEVAHLVATADRENEHGIGDAVVLALHSGQRQGDVLALTEAAVAGGTVGLVQGKRGARVSVPATPALLERLEAVRTRQRAGGLVRMRAGHLVLRPDGQPYRADHFRHAFADVRAVAAAALPEPEATALAAKWFSDLRDTAITRLALAGCTIPEIRAITGHSLESVHQVLKHYLAIDEASARSAITRLKLWMQQEGIAL